MAEESQKNFIRGAIINLCNLVKDHEKDIMIKLPLLGVLSFFDILINQLDDDQIAKVVQNIERCVYEDKQFDQTKNSIVDDLQEIEKILKG